MSTRPAESKQILKQEKNPEDFQNITDKNLNPNLVNKNLNFGKIDVSKNIQNISEIKNSYKDGKPTEGLLENLNPELKFAKNPENQKPMQNDSKNEINQQKSNEISYPVPPNHIYYDYSYQQHMVPSHSLYHPMIFPQSIDNPQKHVTFHTNMYPYTNYPNNYLIGIQAQNYPENGQN